MTVFAFSNWFLCIATSILLFASLWRYRYLFVKPSIVVICLFHLTIQWPTTVQSADVESYLPDPLSFAFLVHGFALIGFLVAFFTGNHHARTVWRRISSPRLISPRIRRRAMWMLAGCIALIVAFYLFKVPFSRTGLAAILTDPGRAVQAREDSLKLVESAFLRYSFNVMKSALAPLLAVLLAEQLFWGLKQKRLLQTLGVTIALAGIVFVVSLPGARIPAALIMLTVLLAFFLRRRLPIKPLYIVAAAVGALSLPAVFTILREGGKLNISSFLHYLTTETMIRRVFIAPTMTGLWHAHYAQTIGFVGIGGIPKLASLFGVEPVPVTNIIGVDPSYLGSSVDSALASTSYVFAYYSYFGLVSLVFSLIGLWLLDAALWFYQRLGDNLLLPCVAAVSVASMNLIGAEYTTVLLTHGFGVLLMVTLIVDRLCRVRLVVRPKQTAEMTVTFLSSEKTPG